MKPLDGTWPDWLQTNLDRGCDREELLGILLTHGFALDSIREHMGAAFPAASAFADAPPPDYEALARVRITRDPRARRVEDERLQLYVVDEFLDAETCDRIVQISSRCLRPSTVTTGDRDPGFRTSSTCDLALTGDPHATALADRIARTVGIRVPYCEGIQAQRYQVGQEFKQHTDFFEPGTPEYARFGGARGQRTWTLMIYCNDGMTAGGTAFPAIDRVFSPSKGTALAWNNLHPDGRPNHATLHAGLPVTAGHKIVVTAWFRERGDGPMFYAD